MLSTQNRHVDTMEILLSYGADITLQNSVGGKFQTHANFHYENSKELSIYIWKETKARFLIISGFFSTGGE